MTAVRAKTSSQRTRTARIKQSGRHRLRPVLRRLIAPDVDLTAALCGTRDIVGGLHAHVRLHLLTEGFFDAQSHVAGQILLGVEQARQRGSGNTQYLRRTLALAWQHRGYNGTGCSSRRTLGWGGVARQSSLLDWSRWQRSRIALFIRQIPDSH